MAEPAKKVRIRVAEAVESGVEGILLFVVRYFRTGISVLGAPKRTARLLLADRHATKPRYVLPLTYLSIGLFLLSLLSQVAGLSILDWIWFVDELASKVTEALSKEVSLVKVAVQALPGVLVVALFGVLLRIGLRRAPVSSRLVTFVLSYAFGAQAWALFVTAFAFVVLGTLVGTWEPPGGKLGTDIFAFLVYAVLIGALLSAVIVPLVFAASALRLRRCIRRARLSGWSVFSVLTAGMIFGHVALLYAMGLPTKVVTLATGPTSPDLKIGRQAYSVVNGTLQVKVSVMMKNRGTKVLAWETAKTEFMVFEKGPDQPAGTCSSKGEVVRFTIVGVDDGAGNRVRFASLEPGQTQWFEVAGSSTMDGWLKAAVGSRADWDVRVTAEPVDGTKAEQCVAGDRP